MTEPFYPDLFAEWLRAMWLLQQQSIWIGGDLGFGRIWALWGKGLHLSINNPARPGEERGGGNHSKGLPGASDLDLVSNPETDGPVLEVFLVP